MRLGLRWRSRRHATLARMLVRPIAVVAAIAVVGVPSCKKEDPPKDDGGPIEIRAKESGGDGGGEDGRTPPTPEPPAAEGGAKLLPPVAYAPLGPQPGYLGDGLLYVGFRAKATHAWLKTLPFPPDLERDAEQAKREIGFNPLEDDWLEVFGVPDDAIISMTILRPLDDGIGAARITLADVSKDFADGYDRFGGRDYDSKVEEFGGPYDFTERKGIEPGKPELKAEEKAAPIAYVPPKVEEDEKKAEKKEDEKKADEERALIEPTPRAEVPIEPPIPTPPPLSVAPELAKVRTMGWQTHAHVPSKDPDKSVAAFVGMFRDNDRERGREACATVSGVECVAESRAVIVLRKSTDAVEIDFIAFAAKAERAEWASTIRTAIGARPTKMPNVEALAGDAAMWLDPSQLSRVAALEKIGSAVQSVEWGDNMADEGARNLARLAWIESLVAAPRMFTGVRLEAVADGETLQARAVWPLAESGMMGRIAASLMAPKPTGRAVPTAEALCKDALMCMRTQRMPDARPLRKRLLTDGFEGDAEEVLDHLDREEEYTIPLIFGGAWANVMATMMNLPEREGLPVAKASALRTVVNAVMRAEGFGGAMLDFHDAGGFFRFEIDYALYGLVHRDDVNGAAGLLTLAGETLSDVDLGELGKAQVYDTRNESPRGMFVYQGPGGDDKDETAPGWIAMVDKQSRYEWLRKLPTEPDAGPAAYFEIGDLWDLVSAFGGSRDADFARSWLKKRAFKVVLDTDEGGAPRMRARLATAQG